MSHFAPPTGETHKLGTVYTAVLSKDGGWAQRFQLSGARDEIRTQSMELALKVLLATELEQEFFDLRMTDAREI